MRGIVPSATTLEGSTISRGSASRFLYHPAVTRHVQEKGATLLDLFFSGHAPDRVADVVGDQ